MSMHGRERMRQSHLIVERRPGRTFAFKIAACGRYGVDLITSGSPGAWVTGQHGTVCKACGALVGRSLERMARAAGLAVPLCDYVEGPAHV